MDDGFEISDENDDWNQVNRFVKLLVSTIDEAATHVHETNIRIKPPTKYPSPYGGRLVWTLPGKTKLTVHIKDKSKIRHRKRWSQVMYMYYLLGHRLMELPISVERKEVIAENTFLLTLDGDIDFQPHAVRLLIDLMKKNKNLGAACGRIHPIGGGNLRKLNWLWTRFNDIVLIYLLYRSIGVVSSFRIRHWSLASKSYWTHDWLRSL